MENEIKSAEQKFTMPDISKRRFWKLEYECWTGGFGGGDYTELRIFWGTWWEAAREVVKNDGSVCRPKHRRKIEPFNLPDTKRKRTSFYVC